MDADLEATVVVVLLPDRGDATRVRDRLAGALARAALPGIPCLVPDDGLRGPAFFSADPDDRRRVGAWFRGVAGAALPPLERCRVVALTDAGHGTSRPALTEPGAPAPGSFVVDGVGEPPGDADAVCDLVLQAITGAPTAASPATVGSPMATDGPAVRHESPVPTRRSFLDRAVEQARRVAGRAPRRARLGRYAQWLIHPDYRAPVILVSNPKGGPGKTTTAIGMALILNEILEEAHVNGRVVLVDGNSRMSDTFRSMPVNPDAVTVRELTTRLRSAPHLVPELQYANSRARNLVVLREQEDSGGYQLQEIQDLARFLREQFFAIVVDLVNDRPGTGSPTERLVQWWLTEASVVVIPTKANLNDFEGAERMLAAVGDVPTVAAYIEPPQRDLRRHPRVRSRLERLRADVEAIYAIPEDHRVRTAALDNLNLTDAVPALRGAFADLTLGVLAIHSEQVHRRLSERGHAAWEPVSTGTHGVGRPY